jgi:hypothetical protein
LGLIGLSLIAVLVWWLINRTPGLPTVRNSFGGYSDNQSLNGFGLLTQLLRQRGHQVARTKILTRQIENADVLFWIHQGAKLPDDQAVELLDDWMDRGGRVVFLGNDYDATLDYWRAVYLASGQGDRELARWVYRNQLRQELDFSIDPLEFVLSEERRYLAGQSNRWMTVVGEEPPQIGSWTGAADEDAWQLGLWEPEGVGPSEGEAAPPLIWVRTWLRPASDGARVVADVAKGDRRVPVMWIEQTAGRAGRPGRDLWVISSPIFLNNFGILQAKNEKLREEFLDQMSPYPRILFLETGPGPVLLSTTPDDRIDRPWAWMSQPPFPLFALHAMLLAVVFCFARFPVFGRAKRVEFRPRNDFGQHLVEVGRLLRSRKLEAFAREKLQQYRHVTGRVHRRRSGPPPEPPGSTAPPGSAHPDSQST